MASTSKIETFNCENGLEEEEEDEEVEHFDDFTLASSWERFISEIEAVCRHWMSDGPKNLLKKDAVRLDSSKDLYKVKAELTDVAKSYCMEYYFENNQNGCINWDSEAHDLQLCFGVKEFLVIAPQSASGVVLDTPESSKLLSAVAIALSNCSSLWPAFVPVHDPSRKAYIGIQNMGTVFTRRFEADHIRSQVPVKLMHLEGLYELFVSKFAYSTMDFTGHLFKVHFTMKLTYRTLPNDEDEDDIPENNGDITQGSPPIDTRSRTLWDDNCPWSEWYSAEDPIKGFELVAIWSEKMIESSLEMAELENHTPFDAHKWILCPNLSTNLVDSPQGSRIGFSSQLRLLVGALDMSFTAQFMEDFVSVENPGSDTLKSSSIIPPPSVTDRVLKELFNEVSGEQLADFSSAQHKNSRAIKGAPQQSLFAQFCLQSLWFGNCNICAIAILWVEFVREVRWCWEELQPLPRMPAGGSIDLTTCLVNQKLHMLAICIENKRQITEDFQDCIGSYDELSSPNDENSVIGEDSLDMQTPDEYLSRKHDSPSTSSESKPEDDVLSNDMETDDSERRGSSGVPGSMKLLKSNQSMHVPLTQDAPLMTEDMHEERLQAVEAAGDLFDFSAHLEKEILSSDMSAFKAANPDAVFEDFIRWHSPGDWVTDTVSDEWPPQGKLSQRMSEQGNMWRKIWNDSPALPASDQKPLLDPNREGEKILHYLETVRPYQLLEQMICTAFRASADTLNHTHYGGLKQMTTKMDQLYLTLASSLKFLQASNLSPGGEWLEDLRRLCGVFEHVEKLLTLAASLHRKFLQTPRLSEAIFTDYYNFYLPRMGTPSTTDTNQTEFNKKQQVRNHERDLVSNMFVPPTANQSWRKVLSMGNLLNGHEPILREIVFSTRDGMVGNHYASRTPQLNQQEIETYRMYICGTSNELCVALSVTSCD